jgi:hypothetical protein
MHSSVIVKARVWLERSAGCGCLLLLIAGGWYLPTAIGWLWRAVVSADPPEGTTWMIVNTFVALLVAVSPVVLALMVAMAFDAHRGPIPRRTYPFFGSAALAPVVAIGSMIVAWTLFLRGHHGLATQLSFAPLLSGVVLLGFAILAVWSASARR